MAPERRPLVVHADARPGSELREERLALDPLGCEVVATQAADEDGLIANLKDADVVLVAAAPRPATKPRTAPPTAASRCRRCRSRR